MKWDTVIGLEVHAQLKTNSKLFSNAPTTFGALANTQANFIDAGLPGVLPVLNQQAVVMAIKFGLAIDANITHAAYFERKNYFYPDLPKGYQISQLTCPIVRAGQLIIDTNGQQKSIMVQSAHLEEDAGKSTHNLCANYTGIDLNRAGISLLEIVTTPCLTCADEVIAYLKTLNELVRFLGICDANMQKGEFRCDVNISLKPAGSTQLGRRVEIKNLNSFRFIRQAIIYEQSRQQQALEQNLPIFQETRSFCTLTKTTQLLRRKEDEQDYRYFPDPDLLPIGITSNDIAAIKQTMPMLPNQIRQTLKAQNVNTDDQAFLLSTPMVYPYFKAVAMQSNAPLTTVINWLKGPYTTALNEAGSDFDTPLVSAQHLAQLLNELSLQTLSHADARKIFAQLCDNEHDLAALIAAQKQQPTLDQTSLMAVINKVIEQFHPQACDYRQGKEKLLAFFVGQVMKQTKGQFNPTEISLLVKKALLTA